jgi:hypothetical protein
LFLDQEQRVARASTAIPGPGKVRFYPPWEATQEVEIVQFTNAARGRVTNEAATLLGFSVQPRRLPPAAGMPLFADDEIVGLSLGRDLVGFAVTSLQIKELLRHAESTTAELITSVNR